MRIINNFLLLLILILPIAVLSEETNQSKSTYNLEGVLIEGRKSKVDSLIDLKEFNTDLDDVIFNRTNFDDYVEIDVKMRPQFAK